MQVAVTVRKTTLAWDDLGPGERARLHHRHRKVYDALRAAAQKPVELAQLSADAPRLVIRETLVNGKPWHHLSTAELSALFQSDRRTFEHLRKQREEGGVSRVDALAANDQVWQPAIVALSDSRTQEAVTLADFDESLHPRAGAEAPARERGRFVKKPEAAEVTSARKDAETRARKKLIADGVRSRDRYEEQVAAEGDDAARKARVDVAGKEARRSAEEKKRSEMSEAGLTFPGWTDNQVQAVGDRAERLERIAEKARAEAEDATRNAARGKPIDDPEALEAQVAEAGEIAADKARKRAAAAADVKIGYEKDSDRAYVSSTAAQVLKEVVHPGGGREVVVSSTYRPAERQVETMFNSLSKPGKTRIKYGEAGTRVQAAYDAAIADGLTPEDDADEIKKRMQDAYPDDPASVSHHASTDPRQATIDLHPSSVGDAIEFMKAAMAHERVTRVLIPTARKPFNTAAVKRFLDEHKEFRSRMKPSNGEDAVHIEMRTD